MIEYKDQSPRDLTLQVLSRPPDISKFTVLRDKEVNICPLLCRAYIIGESHIVWVQVDDQNLLEIFSCAPLKLNQGVLLNHSIGELAQPRKTSHGAFDYLFTCRVEDIKCGADARTILEAGNDWQLTLDFDFPGQLDEHPKTVLAVACKDDKPIIVKSLHSYPNEGKVVFTETQIIRRPL